MAKPPAFIIISNGTIGGTTITYRDANGNLTPIEAVFDMKIHFDAERQQVRGTMEVIVEAEEMAVPAADMQLEPHRSSNPHLDSTYKAKLADLLVPIPVAHDGLWPGEALVVTHAGHQYIESGVYQCNKGKFVRLHTTDEEVTIHEEEKLPATPASYWR